VSRIVGAGVSDANVTSKAAVASRYVAATGLPVPVESHGRPLTGEDELRVLRRCDVIFACVDRHTPRALLNRLAYEALTPVIDMGSGFRVDESGTVTGCAGRVVVIGPGRPCLAC
jgi:molybdopterin/thiamine biosynthesis adenylyltransferase